MNHSKILSAIWGGELCILPPEHPQHPKQILLLQLSFNYIR